MNTSCQKQLPFSSTKITEQIIALPDEMSSQILISEKEYLELKWEIGYWQGMHKKALLREEALKKIIKKQGGQIRDLKNRLFGKKSEKKNSGKKEGAAKPQNLNVLDGSNPAVKDMDVRLVHTFPMLMNRLIFLMSQSVLNAAQPIFAMKAGNRKLMKSRLRHISV